MRTFHRSETLRAVRWDGSPHAAIEIDRLFRHNEPLLEIEFEDAVPDGCLPMLYLCKDGYREPIKLHYWCVSIGDDEDGRNVFFVEDLDGVLTPGTGLMRDHLRHGWVED